MAPKAKKKARDDTSESDDGGESAPSDWADEQWDSLEDAAMAALDRKLDEVCSPGAAIVDAPVRPASKPTPEPVVAFGAAAGAGALSRESGAVDLPAASASGSHAAEVVPSSPPVAPLAVIVPSEMEDHAPEALLRSLGAACFREPYDPEDHFLTPAEMWGGFSDSDDVAGQEHSGRPRTPQCEPRVLPAVARPRDSATMRDPAYFMSTASALSSSSAFRPLLWERGSVPESANGASDVALAPSNAAPGAPSLPSAFAQSSFSGCAPVVDSANWATDAAVARADSGMRLRRMLAGVEEVTLLDELGFEELSQVADDCMRAVVTLRFVLDRQRALTLATTLGDSEERPPDPV